MGSLRNPIGPLPSSIYWRRRAVVLAVLALLILLAVWAVRVIGTAGTGGTDQDGAKGDDGPASAITPGPTDDPSATITQRPGGRDEVGTGGDSDGTGATGGADPGTGGAGAPNGEAQEDGKGGSSTGGTGDDGVGLPAGDGLRDCRSAEVSVSLRSVRNEYEPGTKPKVELVVKSRADTDCKVDFGPEAAVFTISDADGEAVWASDHCPADPDPVLARVPANGTAAYTLTWDRGYRAENTENAGTCTTPSPGKAPPGTYLVEAEVAGKTAQTSFVLSKS